VMSGGSAAAGTDAESTRHQPRLLIRRPGQPPCLPSQAV
jgi:hypothetical protein